LESIGPLPSGSGLSLLNGNSAGGYGVEVWMAEWKRVAVGAAKRAARREAVLVNWEAKRRLWRLRMTSAVAFPGSVVLYWWGFVRWGFPGGSGSRESFFYAHCEGLGQAVELLLPGLAIAITIRWGYGHCMEVADQMRREIELGIIDLELALMKMGRPERAGRPRTGWN
jgi:hypothetical protein